MKFWKWCFRYVNLIDHLFFFFFFQFKNSKRYLNKHFQASKQSGNQIEQKTIDFNYMTIVYLVNNQFTVTVCLFTQKSNNIIYLIQFFYFAIFFFPHPSLLSQFSIHVFFSNIACKINCIQQPISNFLSLAFSILHLFHILFFKNDEKYKRKQKKRKEKNERQTN